MIRLALILVFVPLVAAAQAVAIRSGEHDTFSRLVLSIGEGTEWELEQSDNMVLLRLNGESNGFDLTEVFDRIPRDRISAITQIAPDSLRLTLDCPCDYDAFLWRPGALVLDIINGEDDSATMPIALPAGAPLSEPQAAMVTDNAPTSAPLALPSMLILDRPEPYVAPAENLTLQRPTPGNDISATESALVEGIARAASQGFLDPSITQPDNSETAQNEFKSEPSIAVSPEPNGPTARPGIGISTAMDRDLAFVGAVIEQSIDQQCLPDDLFQIDKWGNGETFHDQAAALAEALAGEFGEEPLEAQETLARLYVHFGFGAEARLVLAADTASSRSRLILSELAGIVDESGGSYPLISTQSGCRTSAALWAFLIGPTPQDEESRNHLMQQFFALPQPLRGQISPRLARQFIDIGETDAAARLLYSVELTDAGVTHDVVSTRALVAERTDDPATALAVLSREANDNARTTPQSLIRLIELQLEQMRTPSEADLLLVATFRAEYKDTPFELELADVEAKGRVAIGQFQLAIDLLGKREDDVAVSIMNQAFLTIIRDSNAGDFLEFAFGDTPESLTAETENAMAARLIDLGFPERASTFLTSSAAREAAAERRYLRAKAAIGIGEYVVVIESLLGMEDDRARALRARAYEGLGEYRAAMAALSPDQSASSPILQFRAKAWERLTDEEDEVLSSFAQVVLAPAENDVAESLADRRAILAQSQESRRAVEGLLLRFDGATPQQ